MTNRIRIVPASQVDSEMAPDFSSPRYRMLAQGDSWFSINGLGLLRASSLLHPANDRLLLTKPERAQLPAGSYLSEDGWSIFAAHLRTQFLALDSMRAASRNNRDVPIITHTYDYPIPRDVGEGLHFGPWLYPALTTYEVPPADWKSLAKVLLDRLFDLVINMPLRNFHVVKTLGAVQPANADPQIKSADWLNEIHPSSAGYAQIAARFCNEVATQRMLP
jgi:hypothetical protein